MPAKVSEGYDFVSRKADNWLRLLSRYIGVKTKMLEIGSFEGGSAVWWLENILTHPESQLTCIDPWNYHHAKEAIFDKNIEESGFKDKVIKIKNISRYTLKVFDEQLFDIVYVDGSHEGLDVMIDATLSLFLLKIGGIMLLDDYKWRGELPNNKGDWGGCVLPQVAIDYFLILAKRHVKVIHTDYQMVIERIK